ncbi:hypothetical protein FUA26_10040 [Seonamhaeicola algicola]|uniref:Uncharacterized protein n=1 Tax=Seonamhaeicola algicola TaxID=1719036 RepID=A0A5C7AQ63_9FLAO|nr:hypothetical protein [Seonamhaeicola algicola]TXE09819.1 hypothetical protein FUA26_10040 [Seonamhaeicola algicola]
MKFKFISILVTCLLFTSVYAQQNLNNYKYIIVPNKFDFLKEKNQYQLNGLAQFLFNKYGFTAIMEGEEYPDDLKFNRCLGLRSDVLKDSGMFKTKLQVELKDCNDRVVYTSPVGESREKEYDKAYNLALRAAFNHIANLNYTYKPSEAITSISTVAKAQPQNSSEKNEVSKEIEALKAEIESLKTSKKQVAEVNTPTQTPTETPKVTTKVEQQPTSNVLYAQAIENGFQLVDSSPKVVYKIKATGLNNVYLVENTSAILYKKESVWVLEYYQNSQLKQETLNIKF